MFVFDYLSACSTCYGDPNSNAGKGMDMAIFTLLGVIGPLLFAILIVSPNNNSLASSFLIDVILLFALTSPCNFLYALNYLL